MKYIAYSSSGSSGPLQKAAAIVVTVAVAAVMLVFSSVFLALLLLAAVVGGAWLWWKTRHVRRMMREMQGHMNQAREAFEGRAPGQGPFGQQGPFSGQAQPARDPEFQGVIIEGEAVRVDEHAARVRR